MRVDHASLETTMELLSMSAQTTETLALELGFGVRYTEMLLRELQKRRRVDHVPVGRTLLWFTLVTIMPQKNEEIQDER